MASSVRHPVGIGPSEEHRWTSPAADAIDYAVLAFYSAQLAVLDALDARAYADERAKIADS
jgi:hypothetical protein